MNKNLLLTFGLLITLSYSSQAQCTAGMTGTFIQVDSCSGFTQSYVRTVTTGDVGFDNLYITNFGNFNPPNDVQVHLDCSNYTLTMYQTLGTTNLTGGGTFEPDFSAMEISYQVDFGSSTMNCIDRYTRSTSGISSLNFPLEMIAYPNPTLDVLKIKVNNLLNVNQITILNSVGQVVFESTLESGQPELSVDMSDFTAGIYCVQVMNGKSFVQQNVVKLAK